MTALLASLFLLWLQLCPAASAQQTCPAGKTNVGCSPTEMDAYGCCPVKKQTSTSSAATPSTPALPQWGQRAANGQCSTGLLASRSTGGVCCWPGQAFNGVTCVGAPQCPSPYVPSGNGCELGTCPAGQVRAGDGLHCCWPGQTFSLQVGACTGSPQCPSGSSLVGDTCVRPTVAVSGRKRAPTQHGTLGTLQWIPSGAFRMGPPQAQRADSQPHDVQLTQGFWMMRSEVTQGMWQAVMGDNPAWFDDCGESCPVEDIDWFQAVEFANELSRREGLAPAYTVAGESVSWDPTASGWRLPTEAEWEYAARGGSGSEVGAGGWNKANSDETTHPVCTAGTNGFGLCDMAGNVWEWCWDFYGAYPTDLAVDPTGPTMGRARVRRGGAWSEASSAGVVYVRDARAPGGADDEIGIRLVRFDP